MHAAAAGGYVDIMACLRLVIKNTLELRYNMQIKLVKPAISEEMNGNICQRLLTTSGLLNTRPITKEDCRNF